MKRSLLDCLSAAGPCRAPLGTPVGHPWRHGHPGNAARLPPAHARCMRSVGSCYCPYALWLLFLFVVSVCCFCLARVAQARATRFQPVASDKLVCTRVRDFLGAPRLGARLLIKASVCESVYSCFCFLLLFLLGARGPGTHTLPAVNLCTSVRVSSRLLAR